MTYSDYITDIIYNKFIEELRSATPGHCMKLSGVADGVLVHLTHRFRADVAGLDTFLLDPSRNEGLYITATRLVELRNRELRPLLVLCPSTLRTAAEDSFGNATFRELPVDDVERLLFEHLCEQLAPMLQVPFRLIQEQVGSEHTPGELNAYLIDLLDKGQSDANLGNLLYHLGLLPDQSLTREVNQLKNRLVYNQQSMQVLATFNQAVYDRVHQLPVHDPSLQRNIASFLNQYPDIRSPQALGRMVYEHAPHLNFSQWTVAELEQQRNVHVFVLALMAVKSSKGTLREDKNGGYVLLCPPDQKAEVTIKFTTQPAPRKEPELASFEIALMRHAGAGDYEHVLDLGRFACSRNTREYQTRKLTLDPSVIEAEDNYFFRVTALDKNQIVLNTDEAFHDRSLQAEWEAERQRCQSIGQTADKSLYKGKLTCDSDSFLFTLDQEQEEQGGDTVGQDRKERIASVLQSYFDYRLGYLRSRENVEAVARDEEDWKWAESGRTSQVSVFIARYADPRYVYQIELPVKLREIEDELLRHPAALGPCQVQLTGTEAFEKGSIVLVNGPLSDESLFMHFVQLRIALFKAIRENVSSEDGVWETFELHKHRKLVTDYVAEYNRIVSQLYAEVQAAHGLDDETRRRLFELTYAVQHLDVIQLQATVQRQETVLACVLPPIHPLRLGWWLLLLEQFEYWESQTMDAPALLSYWTDAVQNLFFGGLFPSNQPLVLPGPENQYSHEYVGELTHGWGLYLHSVSVERDLESMSSRNRLLLQSIQRLLNISGRIQTENDVDKQIVLNHFKNYIQLHPYTEQIDVNLFNAGEGHVFAAALVELEKNPKFRGLRYEMRFFHRADKLIQHGDAIVRLLNPDANASEEAEAFSRSTGDRLHPRLRVSVNRLEEFLRQPDAYDAHLSFLISPFPLRTFVCQPPAGSQSYYLNGLVVEPQLEVNVSHETAAYTWSRFITRSENAVSGPLASLLASGLDNLNQLVSYYLSAGKSSKSLPATQLILSNKDQVLLNLVHRTSDWVITFDHHLGPELYDLPKENDQLPFLLDYIPGERLLGMNTYLTTKPTEEVEHLIAPQLAFISDAPNDISRLATELLEDLRTISGTIILQLNSNPNRVLETIGIGLTKRFLAKKGVLESQVLLPIDLHQYLFADKTVADTKSRADLLLFQISPKERRIHVQVLEIKARTTGLRAAEQEDLMQSMTEQMDNTIRVWNAHFGEDTDRFDRAIKQKEMADMLRFYLLRSYRYKLIHETERQSALQFLSTLDVGYVFTYERKGLIFDFGAELAFSATQLDDDLVFFSIGRLGIHELLNPESSINSRRPDKQSDDIAEHFTRRTRRSITYPDSLPATVIVPSVTGETDQVKYGISEQPQIVEAVSIELFDNTKEDNVRNTSHSAVINNTENVSPPPTAEPGLIAPPAFDLLIGDDEPGGQYGILGQNASRKTIALSLSNVNTISLFGVQGAGKSYTLGVIAEMVLKGLPGINSLKQPLAGVIFHYSESQEYAPEFTAMNQPNTREQELKKLKEVYGATADRIEDIVLLVPKAKVEERRTEYPNLQVLPMTFSSKELSIKDWLFLMGASDNQSLYMKQINNLMRVIRQNITLSLLEDTIANTTLLNSSQKEQARARLMLAHEYIDDQARLGELIRPGRLLIVDLRDQLIQQDEALGLFVIMLNIFANAKSEDGSPYSKFIVFDEAHKYMNNRQLTQNIVTAIREMRHKGVSLLIASQDPPSLPNEIIELSSVLVMHAFRAPQWLKHVQRSLEPTAQLSAKDLSNLNAGEAYVWAAKASSKAMTQQPVKITIRPRVTQHGGATIKAGR